MTTPQVCHISPKTQISQPAVGPLRMRSIPPINTSNGAAAQMASMAEAIAALTYNIQLLSGQLQQRDNGNGNTNQGSGAPGPGKGGSAPRPPNPSKQSRFAEVNRTTEKVKVTNPDDDSQFVEFNQINTLTMVDTITGETWSWNR